MAGSRGRGSDVEGGGREDKERVSGEWLSSALLCSWLRDDLSNTREKDTDCC